MENQPESRTATATEDVLKKTQLQLIGCKVDDFEEPTVYLNDSGSLLVPSLIQTNLLQLSCFKYILSFSYSSNLWLTLHIFK